jgi:hypothetical protein
MAQVGFFGQRLNLHIWWHHLPNLPQPMWVRRGWVLGTCPHMYHPQCIIPFMVQHRYCVLCWVPFHSQLYVMFNLKHYMPPHWEYNAQNAPNYEKKWGTNLIWKWHHGLHALDFVTSFVNFEIDTTMVIIACRALYVDPSDGCWNFFCQVTKGYWNKSNSTSKHISMASNSPHKGMLFV